MVSWSVLPENFPDAAWDEAIQSLPDSCVFQSSAWARHKRNFGWRPLRLAAGDPRRPQAAAQFLARRHPPGVTLAWSRGGPMGDPRSWGAPLRDALVEAAGTPLVYARVCSYRAEEGAAGALRAEGWRRPLRFLNRPATFLLNLGGGEPALRAGLSSNWAHNLRRAQKRCGRPRRWQSPRAGELAALYREMEAYKGLPVQHGEAELRSLLDALGSAAVLYRLDAENGAPLALRACARQKDKGWDLLAASSEAGRKLYASYALLWEILLDCASSGVREYDLGGADPDGAKGVFDFKKGTGARFLEYLGEWDWARPALLRPPASWLASAHGGA